MPYCPKCQYEFKGTVTKCLDCGTELVEQLPTKQDIYVKWISLGKINSSVYAEMIREAMKNKGIESYSHSDLFHDVFSTTATSQAGSYEEIFVPEDKKELAKDIFDTMIQEDGEKE